MQRPSRSRIGACARQVLAIAGLGLIAALPRAEPSPTELVDALNSVFGRHVGMRGSHARGICARGHFEPAGAAAILTRARPMQGGPHPAVLRFSVGGGNPSVSDKSRSVRGLALRLQSDGQTYDLVLISEPVFFASSPEAFVNFLKARTPDPATGRPDLDKIKAHDARYPSSRNQSALLGSHPAPASYASTDYHSNHAFRFVNVAGQSTWARVLAVPAAGTVYLSREMEADLPDRFLDDELNRRLAKEAVEFTLYAQPAAPGDSLTDPSVNWSETGPARIALGRLRVESLAGADACDKTMFVPTVLPDGIEPSDDPVLRARGPAYGVSLGRRL